MVEALDATSFKSAVEFLCAGDPVLATVVERHGMPTLLDRPTGFTTLVYTILEQQVSLASARATFTKLNDKLPELTPQSLLSLSDTELLEIGFSRQKARYSRLLAGAVVEGAMDLEDLSRKSDERVFDMLTSMTGIGPWTANIYLLSALKRPNIWPAGDLALQVAAQELFDLEERPQTEDFMSFGDRWEPYRAVAARILWQYYLSR